jgi:preprotein translocase subunit SecD
LVDGFKGAWSAIRDSNVSSLITAAILYGFGTSFIRGFALTLSIGILLSMFTAIIVTKTLLFLLLEMKILHKPWLLAVKTIHSDSAT